MDKLDVLVAEKNIKMEAMIISSFLAMVFLFAFQAPIHEFGHFLFGKFASVGGTMVFYPSRLSGVYLWQDYPSSWQLTFIAFGGGGFMALLTLGLWFLQPLKRVWYITLFYAIALGYFLVVGLLESLS